MGNLRRRRAIASLYRQTAACCLLTRPRLDLSGEPDPVALVQLESYFWRAERRQPVW
jgi:hypothetical protein